MTILQKLRLILEKTHNGNSFQQQCRIHKIIIEKLSDDTIVAYYADDRDEQSVVDTSIPPFSIIIKFLL